MVFFFEDIKNISKNFDVYFLVSTYGFEDPTFYKSKIDWFKYLKKQKILKKVIYMNDLTYTNFYRNILFNKKLISIINELKLLKIDHFLFPSMFSYWEELLFCIFKNKTMSCYLPNPPSGLDYFNSLTEFRKSFRENKIYKSFDVKSDDEKLHQQNTRYLNNKNIFKFLIQKINIFLSKQISHIIFPLFLIKKVINPNSIYYKLNVNFLKFKKIIIFNQETKNLLNKLPLDKNIKIYFCSKNYIKKKNKNFNWVYPYSSNDKQVLFKLLEYLKMLKKLKKINKIYFKEHPTWKHKKIEKNFFLKLKKNGIKYAFLDSYKNINYSKYYGLISNPSSVILESAYNQPSIKIIIIKGKNHASGMLHKFYMSVNRKNLWDPTYKQLVNFLKKNNKPKLGSKNFKKILLEISNAKY